MSQYFGMANLSADLVAIKGGGADTRPGRGSDARGWFRISLVYCLIVFAVSWSILIYALITSDAPLRFDVGLIHFNLTRRWAISTCAGFAPGVVALLLGLVSKWGYFPSLSSQLRAPIPSKRLYILSVTGPVAIFLASRLIGESLGSVKESSLGLGDLFSFVGLFLFNLPLAPVWEEPGWRGCLLPILSRRFGLWRSSLAVGAIWAVWHLPAYLLGLETSVSHYLAFCICTVGMSVVLTALYKAGGNSLRLPMLFHASWNSSSWALTTVDSGHGPHMIVLLALCTWMLGVFCWLWFSEKDPEDRRSEL